MTALPKLLKERQYHSRVFAVLAIGLLLISHPLLKGNDAWRQWMVWIGYALVILGAFGRVYCSAFIGGRKNDEVVRQGPFSVVRNPLYVFSFIATLGVGLESGMVTILALLALTFVVYYPWVVRKEEAFLKHRFGEPYEVYMREVPRWIPNLKLWSEPEQYDVKPRFIRKTAMDAAIFFLPMPCFAILGMLHGHHILPVWLTLP